MSSVTGGVITIRTCTLKLDYFTGRIVFELSYSCLNTQQFNWQLHCFYIPSTKQKKMSGVAFAISMKKSPSCHYSRQVKGHKDLPKLIDNYL